MPPTPDDDRAVGTLRAAVTVLVVVHHALLAYHPFAPPPGGGLTGPMPFWRAFPVVDAERWSGATWIVGANDTFFMALMFAISGVFVWRSLARKGPARFVRDRAWRLGVPFLIAAGLLAPLAYYPTYLQAGGDGIGAFISQWRAIEWSIGPAWFLSLLLVFDLLAAGLYAIVARTRTPTTPTTTAPVARRQRPVAWFLALTAVSIAAYVPLSRFVAEYEWTTLGPIVFQTGRLLHYAVYFAAGVAAGALALPLAARAGALARWAPAWVILAGATFYASMYAGVRVYTSGGETLWKVLSAHAFTVACAALSFAALAIAGRLAGGAPGRITGRITASLRDNAYRMFLVHYPIVSWTQYALLDSGLSGATRAALACAASIAATWVVAAALGHAGRALASGTAGRAGQAMAAR